MENKENTKLRVLIVCGGTGGHIYPAVALADALVKTNMEAIVLISKKEDMAEILNYNSGYEVRYLQLLTPTRPLLRMNINFIFSHLKSMIAAMRFIKTYKPNVVVGMGSHYMLPGVLAAKLCGLPLVLYEQNIILGKANRFALPFAKSICVNFPETIESIRRKIEKVVVGMPQRKFSQITKEEALEYFNLDMGRFTLFLFGGSQGSRSINCLLWQLKHMVEELNLQIIHISGPRDYQALKENMQDQKYIKIYPYLHNIEYGYVASDLVIARAGAATVSELIHFKKVAILIPYPFASKDHQLLNALYLERQGAAVVVKEGPDFAKEVLYWVRQLYENHSLYQELNHNLNSFGETYPQTNKFIEAIRRCSQNS